MTSQDIMTSAIARKGSLPMSEDKGLPRDVPVDPQVPPESQENWVRSTFAAELVGVTPGTIHRHWKYYKTLTGRMVGHTLLVSREEMRWWEPGRPGPKTKTDREFTPPNC